MSESSQPQEPQEPQEPQRGEKRASSDNPPNPAPPTKRNKTEDALIDDFFKNEGIRREDLKRSEEDLLGTIEAHSPARCFGFCKKHDRGMQTVFGRQLPFEIVLMVKNPDGVVKIRSRLSHDDNTGLWLRAELMGSAPWLRVEGYAQV